MIILDKEEKIYFLKNGVAIVEHKGDLYVVYDDLFKCDKVCIYSKYDQTYGVDHPDHYPKYVHNEIKKAISLIY